MQSAWKCYSSPSPSLSELNTFGKDNPNEVVAGVYHLSVENTESLSSCHSTRNSRYCFKIWVLTTLRFCTGPFHHLLRKDNAPQTRGHGIRHSSWHLPPLWRSRRRLVTYSAIFAIMIAAFSCSSVTSPMTAWYGDTNPQVLKKHQRISLTAHD